MRGKVYYVAVGKVWITLRSIDALERSGNNMGSMCTILIPLLFGRVQQVLAENNHPRSQQCNAAD